jgi:dTDP-4-dehydrorhamnose reductase
MSTRILVTGGSGQLGGYLLRKLQQHSELTVIAWSGSRATTLFGHSVLPVDITNQEATAAAFAAARPERVIHAAALGRIDECYRNPALAEAVNTHATRHLADLAERARTRFVYVSTDLVFDGSQGHYQEDDDARPLSMYGKSKLAGESSVLGRPQMTVARLSLLFGPTLVGRPGFFDKQLAAIRNGQPLRLFADEWRTPLSLLTAAEFLITIACADHSGLLHLGGRQRMSRLEMGQRLAQEIGGSSNAFVSSLQGEVPAPEPRPRDVSLDSSRFRTLFPQQPWPTFEEALVELLA